MMQVKLSVKFDRVDIGKGSNLWYDLSFGLHAHILDEWAY